MKLIILSSISTIKGQITESQLTSIMGECSKSEGESINCNKATPLINQAMKRYRINTKPGMAIMISNIKLESANMQFNKNKVPGRPGQGTRCMLMPDNLLLFAKDQGKSIGNQKLQSYENVEASNETEEQKDEILEILNKNEYSFLPCAWWIKSGASLSKPNCKNPLYLINEGTDASTTKYFTDCMGVSNVDERIKAYKEVLNKL